MRAAPTTVPQARPALVAVRGRWAGALEAWLFPTAPLSHISRRVLAAGYLAGGAAVAGAALLRQTGVPAWQTMWAEDGKVFYNQALSMPFARTLVTPNAGYVQLFPRLAAAIAALVPVGGASIVMSLVGAVSLGVLSCLVFHMARGHIASPWLRGLLAASMVLLPVASGELLDNAVNVPWWLFFVCFWALLWRPRSWAGAGGGAALCALAAASEPLTALLLPLVLLRVVALVPWRPAGAAGGGWLRQQAAGLGLAAGLVFQAAVRLANGSGGGTAPSFRVGAGRALVQALGLRVGLGLLAGARATNWLAAHQRDLATGIGLVLICLVAVVGARSAASRARAFAIVATICAVGFFVLEVWARGISPIVAGDQVQAGSRYQAVPLLLLLSSVAVTADNWATVGWGRVARAPAGLHGRPRSRRAGFRPRELVAATACAVLLLPTWVVDFRDTNARSHGPSWPAGAASAAHRCAAKGTQDVLVAIDPSGWAATVPCRRLGPG